MKTAGIVTYYNSYSIGATLQAYATKELFAELGFDAHFVPYINNYEQAGKSIMRPADGLGPSVKSFAKNVIFGGRTCLRRAYESESRFYYPPSKVTSNPKDVSQCSWDVLVSGSDQIWNPQISGGIDPVHFLAYGTASKRVALASSAGSHVFTPAELSVIVPYLQEYDIVTVRESHLKRQIEGRISAGVSVCLDPTLLFNGDWWRLRSSEHNVRDWGQFSTEKYILTYFMGKGFHEYYPRIKEYITECGYSVWNVQFNRWKRQGVDRTIPYASPVDFISLIDNASLVISDSFHGVALSLNLNVPVIAINNTNNPIRVRELLESCDLSSLLEPESCRTSLACDFASSNAFLGRERAAIRDRLRNGLK